MKLFTALRLELAKIYLMRGTYVGYAILAAITFLTLWGMWQWHPVEHMSRRLGNDMVVGGKTLTGLMPARYVMGPALLILIPMLIAAISGGLVAGESKSGVLRTWLCRPVSRLTLLTAKQLASWLHALSLTLFLGLLALGLGYLFFGGGDLVDVMSGDGLVILDERLALIRLALAYGIAAYVMCGFASLSFLASVSFESPLVAAAAAVAFLPVATIISQFEYFACLKPYLLTNYFDLWRHVFKATLQWSDFRTGVYCIAAYCVIPYVIGAIIFWRKDVTS